MAGSGFGTLFRVTTFGESHGPAVGAVVDGCPAGLALSEEDIQVMLDRRKPGGSEFATMRQEGDLCRILSGVFEGRTTGTPIAVVIENTDQRSRDYTQIAAVYRPGHADFGFDKKYGFRDYRGGGRSSGRETAGRVIGGAVAGKLLAEFGIKTRAWTQSIGPVQVNPESSDLEYCKENSLYMPDRVAADLAGAYLRQLMEQRDSSGGSIGCLVTGVPAGLGEPVFDKLDAEIAKAVMSIGAVKGIAFGAGFEVCTARGSENNDAFYMENGVMKKRTNHAGGILGGMSDGSSIYLEAAVKPTPSIARPQETVNRDGETVEVEIHGRHDPVIVPRAVVVVEAMVNLVLADLLMKNAGSRIESLRKIYG